MDKKRQVNKGVLYTDDGLRRCSGYGPANLLSHYVHPSAFHKDCTYADGLGSRCIACTKVKNEISNKKNNSEIRPGGKYEEAYWRKYNKRRHNKREAPYDPSLRPHLVWLYNLGICHICLKFVPFEHVTMDHVVPLCDGGGWTWYNIRPAHEHCNGRKGKNSMQVCEERGLLAELRAPHRKERLMLMSENNSNENSNKGTPAKSKPTVMNEPIVLSMDENGEPIDTDEDNNNG